MAVGASSALQVICTCSRTIALSGVACSVPAAHCNSDTVHLQVQQDLIWVWAESGPDAAEESLGKSPALGTLLSETSPGEGSSGNLDGLSIHSHVHTSRQQELFHSRQLEEVTLVIALALCSAAQCQHSTKSCSAE